MEKKTIYIHTTKDKVFCIDDCDLESVENNLQNEESDEIVNCRVVTFVNGNRDIMKVIKDLIKDQYQSR